MKFKSCILASILGLINFIPSTTNAQFVENQNYPYFFNQADHLEEGLWWFRSKINPKEVFFIVVRQINLIDKKKWDFVCRRDHKFFNQFKKYHYQILHVDNASRRIVPDDLQEDENEFYKFLYTNYSRAATRTGVLPANLLYDNPLDNSGWFYKGFGTNDLEERVRESKYRKNDKGTNPINMFSANTGNYKKEKNAFKKYEERLCKHSDLENIIKYFKDNVYLQHGQTNSTEIIDNYENLKKLNLLGANPYTKNADLPLQNQKHVFFSPVMPGRENLNQYSDSEKFNKFFHMDNKRFLNLPLVSGSLDMGGQVLGCRCFVGKPVDVLTNIALDSEYVSRHDGTEFYHLTPSKHMNKNFTDHEIRIPTYIFSDQWLNKGEDRYEKPGLYQKDFEQKCDKLKNKFNQMLPKYGG